MFNKLTKAVIAFASMVSAEDSNSGANYVSQWTPCDSQISCATKLNVTTGATCLAINTSPYQYSVTTADLAPFKAMGWPTQPLKDGNRVTGCFLWSNITSGFDGQYNF